MNCYMLSLVYRCFVLTQVFTGTIPFNDDQPAMVAMIIMRGNHLLQPTHLACLDELWVLMQRCWDWKPLSCLKVSEVLQVLPRSNFYNL